MKIRTDYSVHGWSEEQVAAMTAKALGNFGKIISQMPADFKRLREGDVRNIGQRQYTVVVGRATASRAKMQSAFTKHGIDEQVSLSL